MDTINMEATPKELIIYETTDGKRPFEKWIYGLRDKATIARIVSRLDRIADGNFGDVKPLGDAFILLLCGGDKGSQARDIKTAKKYLEDYNMRRRSHGKNK